MFGDKQTTEKQTGFKFIKKDTKNNSVSTNTGNKTIFNKKNDIFDLLNADTKPSNTQQIDIYNIFQPQQQVIDLTKSKNKINIVNKNSAQLLEESINSIKPSNIIQPQLLTTDDKKKEFNFDLVYENVDALKPAEKDPFEFVNNLLKN